MALRKFVDKLTKPTEQVDRERLAEWCSSTGCTSLDQIEVRRRRKILGISPGRRVFLEGVVANDGTTHVMYNPLYEFA